LKKLAQVRRTGSLSSSKEAAMVSRDGRRSETIRNSIIVFGSNLSRYPPVMVYLLISLLASVRVISISVVQISHQHLTSARVRVDDARTERRQKNYIVLDVRWQWCN